MGERVAIGAPAAIANAISDAVKPLGIAVTALPIPAAPLVKPARRS
jgi:CO/xanthine dehydrogenase Mo-binding subunit